jgi:hypothetical protein
MTHVSNSGKVLGSESGKESGIASDKGPGKHLGKTLGKEARQDKCARQGDFFVSGSI